MITAKNRDAGERLLSLTEPEGAAYTCHQYFLVESIRARFGKDNVGECFQAVYPRKTPSEALLSQAGRVQIGRLDESYTDVVSRHYRLLHDRTYLQRRLACGVMLGAFLDGELAGFAGVHEEGGMGMLEVFEKFRGQGIGSALEAALIGEELERRHTPYCQIFSDNEISLALQKKLGLRIADRKIYWIS
ncbi:MAG: GNAT family N-acetyltransferase [Eubacteriales bacterium]|nr:GNAT family N-acetyltransferase [Eubacteriales bacterium]